MIFKAEIPETVNYDSANRTHKINFTWGGGLEDRYNGDFASHFDDLTGKHANVLVPSSKNAKRPSVVVLPNEPMEGLRFVGISYSKMASDSLRVRLPNEFVVDISTAGFMAAILNEGIQPGGVIPGKWIWARVPGSMMLVRIGSGIHQAILDYINREVKPKYEVREMNVGRVYSDPEENFAIFLGFINSYTMHVRIHPEDKGLVSHRKNYGTRDWKKKKLGIRYDVEFKRAGLATLWYELWGTKSEIEARRTEFTERLSGDSRWSFKATKRHKFVEELDIPKFDVPDDIIMQQRRIAKTELQNDFKRISIRETGGGRYGYGYANQMDKVDITGYKPTYDAAVEARGVAMRACMVPFPVEPMLSEELERFKPFQKEKDSELSKAIEAARIEKRKSKNKN